MAKTGRPKTFSGTQIGVLLPATVDLRLRREAEKSGRTISEIVRATLDERWGQEQSDGE